MTLAPVEHVNKAGPDGPCERGPVTIHADDRLGRTEQGSKHVMLFWLVAALGGKELWCMSVFVQLSAAVAHVSVCPGVDVEAAGTCNAFAPSWG